MPTVTNILNVPTEGCRKLFLQNLCEVKKQ